MNYRGSSVYKTKVGAFFSYATYALVLFNLIALIESFFDGSEQKESQRAEKYDRFFNDGYYLSDGLLQLSVINLLGPELAKVGKIRLQVQTLK